MTVQADNKTAAGSLVAVVAYMVACLSRVIEIAGRVVAVLGLKVTRARASLSFRMGSRTPKDLWTAGFRSHLLSYAFPRMPCSQSPA